MLSVICTLGFIHYLPRIILFTKVLTLTECPGSFNILFLDRFIIVSGLKRPIQNDMLF